MIAGRNGGKDGIVNTGFAKLSLYDPLSFSVQIFGRIKNVSADIFFDAYFIIKMLPKPGNTTEYSLCFNTLFHTETGEIFHHKFEIKFLDL